MRFRKNGGKLYAGKYVAEMAADHTILFPLLTEIKYMDFKVWGLMASSVITFLRVDICIFDGKGKIWARELFIGVRDAGPGSI